MLFDNNFNPLGTEWKKNATYAMGIPLHPSGETDIYTYTTEFPEDMKLMRARRQGLCFQGISTIMMLFLFMRNFKIAMGMAVSRRNTLTPWCCLIPSALGLIFCALTIAALFTKGVNCRILIWVIGFGVTSTLMCNCFILLQKAYLILMRQRWVLLVGLSFTLPQISYLILVLTICPVTIEEEKGCVYHYPPYLPWLWFGVTTPINMFLSGIFCHVAYKQYRLFGSNAWKRISRDGIQTMCLAVSCNVVCGVFILFEVGGNFSTMSYVADWILASTILIEHCQNMRKISGYTNQPKTEYLEHVSQIVTMKTKLEYEQIDS
ncbi:hypothetical protein BDF19DRAFT_499581 [Syncephalis fuscata]|nr:hypothetical protein BDF19DRAFT_499581 [Syncephalis fuscata]